MGSIPSKAREVPPAARHNQKAHPVRAGWARSFIK